MMVARTAMMSAQAWQFLEEAPSMDEEALDLDVLVNMRAQLRKDFAPSSERAVKRHNVSTRTIEVAGVDCMEVKPAQGCSDRVVLYCYGGGYVTGSPF